MNAAPIDTRVVDATIKGEFPTPIAEAWGWVRQAKNLHDDVEAPIQCFEVLLRFLGGALLSDYLSGGPVPVVEGLLGALDERPTMGHRLNLVRELCRALPPSRIPAPFFTEAHGWLFDERGGATAAHERLAAMVADRNVKTHQTGRQGARASRDWAHAFRRELSEVLYGLRWLGRYRLFTVHGTEPTRRRTQEGRVQVFRGVTPCTEQGEWNDVYLLPNSAHIVDPTGRIALDVSPFIVWAQTQAADVERIHVWRSVDADGAVVVVNDEYNSEMRVKASLPEGKVTISQFLAGRTRAGLRHELGACAPGPLVLPASDPSLLSETVFDGRFRLEQILGEGGMANVYGVTDIVTREARALKVLKHGIALDPVLRDRFHREERILRVVECEFILGDVKGGNLPLPDGRPYLSMPLCDGTVQERLERGPIPRELAGRWMRQLMAALKALHAAKVIHRDIKPSNMLLDAAENLRLADLGVALETESARLTQVGHGAMYTDGYAAKEARLGMAEFASDVYSAGVVAHQLLTGRMPSATIGQGLSKPERQLLASMLKEEASQRATVGEATAAIHLLFPPPAPRSAGSESVAGGAEAEGAKADEGVAALLAAEERWAEAEDRAAAAEARVGELTATLVAAEGLAAELQARLAAAERTAEELTAKWVAADGHAAELRARVLAAEGRAEAAERRVAEAGAGGALLEPRVADAPLAGPQERAGGTPVGRAAGAIPQVSGAASGERAASIVLAATRAAAWALGGGQVRMPARPMGEGKAAPPASPPGEPQPTAKPSSRAEISAALTELERCFPGDRCPPELERMRAALSGNGRLDSEVLALPLMDLWMRENRKGTAGAQFARAWKRIEGLVAALD